jgi:hypothetical protein
MVPSLTPEEALEEVCSGIFDLVWFGLELGCSWLFFGVCVWRVDISGVYMRHTGRGGMWLLCSCCTHLFHKSALGGVTHENW